MIQGRRFGRVSALLLPFAFCLLPSLLSGCAVVGVVAHALPPANILPKYSGLAGQSVGVMVWADRGIRIDYPTIQVDLATSLQNKLKNLDIEDLEGTTWPVDPRSIVRYQQDHPEIQAMSVTDVAPKLGVLRLIYIEIEQFATRSEASLDLYRGSITATIKVIEIANGTATVAFEENNVQVVFPPKVPQEGIPSGNDYRMYMGTVDEFTSAAALRFITHPED